MLSNNGKQHVIMQRIDKEAAQLSSDMPPSSCCKRLWDYRGVPAAKVNQWTKIQMILVV